MKFAPILVLAVLGMAMANPVPSFADDTLEARDDLDMKRNLEVPRGYDEKYDHKKHKKPDYKKHHKKPDDKKHHKKPDDKKHHKDHKKPHKPDHKKPPKKPDHKKPPKKPDHKKDDKEKYDK